MRLLTSKGKRSFIYSVIILFILGIFALGYVFYFIPRNTKIIHKNGFLILRTISSSIANVVESRITNYENWSRNCNYSEDSIESFLRNKDFEGMEVKTNVLKDSNFVKFRILGNKVVIGFEVGDNSERAVQISEPVGQFFESSLKNIFSPQKEELFSFYALQETNRDTARILYQDTELALRADVADSLLPKGSGSNVAGIRDFTSKNVDLKMFYYPFAIDKSTFILSGFVETDIYTQSIRKIPFYFVYPLVIIFLLLLILFPVIKFYIMDSNEPLRTRDVIFFGASSILCSSLLTILIIQFLLWQGEENRVKSNLEKISGQIQAAFNVELKRIYGEIELLDDEMRIANKLIHGGPPSDISNSVRSFLTNSKGDDSTYLHFDRMSWIDNAGNQTIKAELYGKPVFTNVVKRNYFEVFKWGTPYLLPGKPEEEFGWEPIYSWTNNEFNISVSLKSEETIVAMATKMYSLVQTILPAGYGYCIVDEEGNVQVHSNGSRNLRENFFEKTDHPGELEGAVTSRQSKIINYVEVYGKLHMMHVQPLGESLPFYLISFYDEGYIAPVNLRILIFTLLLCTLFFIISVILWGILGRKEASSYALVFCKMDFLDWITPKSEEAKFYFHAFVGTIFYVFFILGFVLFNRHYAISNFNVLSVLFLTPVNIVLLLHCMRFAFNKVGNKRTIVKTAIIHFILTIIFYFLVNTKYPLTGNFLVFQFLVNAFMWIYCFSPRKSFIFSFQSPFNFFRSYTFLITSLVICLSVLPASLFTWYAHNQELIQSVKRQQLYLGNSIRERSFSIQQQKNFADIMLPDRYFDSLRLSYGIYRIHEDRFDDTCRDSDSGTGTGFEKFYFEVAAKLTTRYYNEQSYAALEDKALDSSWWWTIRDNTMHFQYQPAMPRRRMGRQTAEASCLHIISAMPDRFIYLTLGRIIPMALITILLVMGLFNWLGKNARRIFLTRFIYSPLAAGNKRNEFFAAFFDKRPLVESERLYTPARYKTYSIQCDAEELLEYERELVDDIEQGKELYTHIWNSCSEKEKFLLYGFAVDGTINYKNSKEIIEMMNTGVLVVEEERLRIFSPGFRAFILCSIDERVITVLQKQHRESSTWHYIRVPLMILLIGIAALVFFTQQGIFDKILVLAGGVSTLIGLVTRFFSGNATPKKA